MGGAAARAGLLLCDGLVFTDVQGPAPRRPPSSRMDASSAETSDLGDGRPGQMASASGGPPRPAQRLPANQRAPERKKRLMDVGSLVIAHAQAAKLTEPGKGALDDPPPSAQATPMRRAAHGQPRHDVTSPETAP